MIIGLTGSFATGKSTVARMFHALGAKIINADKIAHKVLDEPSIKNKLLILFGDDISARNRISRRKLGKLVFSNRDLVVKLNKVVHPPVIAEIKKELRKNKQTKFNQRKVIVLDAPLLIEAGLLKLVDYLVVVKCSKINQIRRGIKNGFNKSQAIRRIQAQMPLKYKIRLANFVVNNNFSLEKTNAEVKSIWQKITPKK